ncbi:hypothetical protein KM043_016482 [Ampulex compressa]|nr:hypothetical protein KM043_016482 [Ampulex compressa]
MSKGNGREKNLSQEQSENEADQTIRENSEDKRRCTGGTPASSLTEEKINKMTVQQLKNELEKLNLQATGKKQYLRNVLLKHIQEDETEDNATTEDDSEEDSDMTDEEEEKPRKRGSGGRQHTQRRRRTTKFTIKDVDESLAHFTGDDKLPIEGWIEAFEELSTLLEWDETQKLLYGKRMLKGSAKQFITYQRGLMSWKSLKGRLLREFKTEVNSAVVHAELARRKRRSNESARQYIGAMQEIANQCDVEEEAIIEHIINGISDEEDNKTMLRFNRKEAEQKRGKPGKIKRSHCYGCGSIEHDHLNCPNKEKGPKCFNCNSFGHIATVCPEKKTKQSIAKVNCVGSYSNESVSIKVDNMRCAELVDTGSDVSLIRQDIYKKTNNEELCQTSRVLTGFGKAQVVPIGRFNAKVLIDEYEYTISMLVVPQGVMTSEVILGHDFLAKVKFCSDKGTIISMTPATSSEHAVGDKNKSGDDRECNEAIAELANINFVESDELNNYTSYYKKIKKLIATYSPAKGVKTAVETTIKLRQEEPICAQPMRLAPKERAILDKQIMTKVKKNNRYEVVRVGDSEGPRITSSAADSMKHYDVISSEGEEGYAGVAE